MGKRGRPRRERGEEEYGPSFDDYRSEDHGSDDYRSDDVSAPGFADSGAADGDWADGRTADDRSAADRWAAGHAGEDRTYDDRTSRRSSEPFIDYHSPVEPQPEPAPGPERDHASGGADDDGPDRDGLDDDAFGDAFDDEGESERTAGRGRAERRQAARRIKRRRRSSAVREVPILIGVALIIALLLKTFLVQAFVIPSGSMEDTLRVGDRVLVNKLSPWFGAEPQRGDVVVFQDPGDWLKDEPPPPPDPEGLRQVKEFFSWIGLLPAANRQDLIKRVIAVGGDRVQCCDMRGRIMVNGHSLDEPYVAPGNPPSQIRFDVKVPKGRLWVMGDHRSNSADSRYHMTDPGDGTIPESLVVGKAFAVAWPVSHWRRLQDPATFADVPPPYVASSAAGAPGPVKDGQVLTQLPTPAELPLVMGVMGLYRVRRRQTRRSEEWKWGTLWSAHGPDQASRKARAHRWDRLTGRRR